MSKDMERKIIIIMLLYLVFLGISGCMAKPKVETNPTQQPNVNVYNGTLSTMLGCIFAPNECNKFKKEKQNEELQEEITQEMMEMDEDISKDNK